MPDPNAANYAASGSYSQQGTTRFNMDQFTGFVDSYLGQLDPTQLAMYRGAQRGDYSEGAGAPASAQALSMLKQKFGWDDRTANEFLRMSRAVIKGDENTALYAASQMGIDPASAGNPDMFEKQLRSLFSGGPTAEGAADPNVDQVTANINKFLEGLNPGSPEYQQAQVYISKRAQSAQGASSARAGLGSFGSGGAQTGQGLGGGLSAYGEGTIQADMNTKYRLQNEQLKAQGLGLLNQRDLGLKGLEQGYQQMQNQQAEQAWAAQQNQNQGIGSAIGAGLGALGFIGGPALGAATMSGGAAVGGALGGLASGGSAPRYASMPSWTQGGGNKGSLGGSGY